MRTSISGWRLCGGRLDTTPRDRRCSGLPACSAWPVAGRVRAHLFWIQIRAAISRRVFRQTIHFKSLPDGFRNDVFELVFRVPAELARVGVMAVRHIGCKGQQMSAGSSCP
jgi:hypothetical protein